MLEIHARMLFLAARVRALSDAGISMDRIRKTPFSGNAANERVRLVAPRDRIGSLR